MDLDSRLIEDGEICCDRPRLRTVLILNCPPKAGVASSNLAGRAIFSLFAMAYENKTGDDSIRFWRLCEFCVNGGSGD